MTFKEHGAWSTCGSLLSFKLESWARVSHPQNLFNSNPTEAPLISRFRFFSASWLLRGATSEIDGIERHYRECKSIMQISWEQLGFMHHEQRQSDKPLSMVAARCFYLSLRNHSRRKIINKTISQRGILKRRWDILTLRHNHVPNDFNLALPTSCATRSSSDCAAHFHKGACDCHWTKEREIESGKEDNFHFYDRPQDWNLW